MSFQTTVNTFTGQGVPGDLFTNSPIRAQSFIINTPSHPEYNIIGATGFSITGQGTASAGNSGTAVFAGILANPKEQLSVGTTSSPLAPTLTLPNNSQASLVTMGTMFVTLPAAAAIGDWVVYDNTTGALSTVSPGAALPAGKSWAWATVDYYTVAAAGLAVITLTPSLAAP